MAGLMELEYVEIDGLLYPNIDIGENRLQNLGKFGKARLEHLHNNNFVYYRELLIASKLAEHCEQVDAEGYALSEKLQQQYIAKHPLPDDDFVETVGIRTPARAWAEEVVINQISYE